MSAAYFWAPGLGSHGLATTAANWRTGPSLLAPTHTQAPDADDDLYFRGDVSVANCTIPDMGTTSGVAFQGIHLLFGTPLTPIPGPNGSPPVAPPPEAYTGTVTIKDSFAVGVLEVDCGAIKQEDPTTLNPLPLAPSTPAR